jgi:endogenous inhibitor of DNA gyrase (YacG/DUF329 family)
MVLVTNCPTCKKKVEAESLSDHEHFPFCSRRCRFADLDRWFEEEYAVPGDQPGEEGADD